MSDFNKEQLKQINDGKAPTDKGFKIPGSEQLSKLAKHAKPKNVMDIVLFGAGILLMLKFGKMVADELDNQMPTEKSMMEMMKTMQAQQGMPPMP